MQCSREESWERRFGRQAWAAVMVVLVLAGCGGGGGGGGAPDGGNPDPELPPATARPSGQLWHNDYALDYLDGTQVASLDGGLPRVVSSNSAAVPWPDGSQFAIHDWNVADDYTDFQVIDTASGATIYQAQATGYLRDLRPSPTDKTVLMATLGEDTISPADTVFIDLKAMTVLRRFSADDTVNWLPDGRYLRVHGDGSLVIGDLAAGEVPAGQVEPPTNSHVQSLWVSPKGDQVAWSVVHRIEPIPEVDIWVSALDGSGLERVTRTTMSHYAYWSPDGSKLAFDYDTGHICNGFGCMGSCELWWVPATARQVMAVPAAHDAWTFKVKNRNGEEQTLGCELMAWTR